jgi:ribulose-phosphate 3-epimerase
MLPFAECLDCANRGLKLERKIEIAPSVLSADFANLAGEIEKVERGGAGLIHLDIMDGHFVPNITIGPPVVAAIRKITGLPLDTHLMIDNPERYLEDFIRAGADWISVHVEVDNHLDRTLNFLRDNGVRAGVAINPATPIGSLEEILPIVDYILVMTVNPGFGGQRFIPSTLKKIEHLRKTLVSMGYDVLIEVDGGIGPTNLSDVLSAGADIIVAGSAIFRAEKDASEVVREMKSIAGQRTRELKTV